MSNREWVIGDTGWILSQYNGIEEVTITSEKLESKEIQQPYYKVHSKTSLGDMYQSSSTIFESYKEARLYRESYKKSKIDSYKEKIKSKDDLLNFIVGYMYCDEYTNYEAIAAAKDKCIELFGVHIKES